MYRVKEKSPTDAAVSAGLKKIGIMIREEVVILAKAFLSVADTLNNEVSNYLSGSEAAKDRKAYEIVRDADKKFIDALNEYERERYEYGLNYELAEAYNDEN